MSSSDSPRPASSRAERRITWIVGGRGDVLFLGPVFQEFSKARRPGMHHWLLDSAEAGLAAIQARDLIGLIPDETGDLCHPADEPAIRLALMIERSESFIRRRKGTHVIFSGWGPTAAATAIYCHARGCRGLWLRPPDPAGLIPPLRWEAGLERLIRASAPCVEVWQIPETGVGFDYAGKHEARNAERGEGNSAFRIPHSAFPGRPGAPIVLIAVLRRDWGYLDDGTSRLARAAGQWAKLHPETDFLILSNLNARLEGPVRSLRERPANLLLSPPLPYPIYQAALERARLVLTDSPLIATEALERALPVATLGDLPPAPPAQGQKKSPGSHFALVPGDLETVSWSQTLSGILEKPESQTQPAAAAAIHQEIRAAIEAWLES